MAKVELKQPVVAEIAELFNGAKSAVAVDYRGLTVEQDTALRKQLREAGITYKVYKNTMIRFAAKGTEFEALDPNLEGPLWPYRRKTLRLRQEFLRSSRRRPTSSN